MELGSDRLARVGCFLLDMDGTFYLGDHLLEGALRFLEVVARLRKEYLFLTNNSSKDRGQYARKLRRLGLEIRESQIFTSGEATALYLVQRMPGAKVYLVGTPSLEAEFADHGIRLVREEPEVVVLGFDTTLTYAKLWRLCDWVRRGIPYIATQPDLNCPTEDGLMPDVGAMIAFVEASTGRRPDVVVGKPNPPIVECLTQKTGIPAHGLCMVGDRLYTDVALGELGLTTVLVLSGEAKRADLAKSPYHPDYVVESLEELARVLEEMGETGPGPGSQPVGPAR